VDKPKVLMVGLYLVLIVVLAAYGAYEITSSVDNPGGEEESCLRISNVAHCASDPGTGLVRIRLTLWVRNTIGGFE